MALFQKNLPFCEVFARDAVYPRPLPGTSIPCKISQYADDTNLFISDTNSVRIIELYEFVSGAKLNKSKTFGMWLGRWRGRSDQPCNLTWSSDCKKLSYTVFILVQMKGLIRIGNLSLINLRDVLTCILVERCLSGGRV